DDRRHSPSVRTCKSASGIQRSKEVGKQRSVLVLFVAVGNIGIRVGVVHVVWIRRIGHAVGVGLFLPDQAREVVDNSSVALIDESRIRTGSIGQLMEVCDLFEKTIETPRL